MPTIGVDGSDTVTNVELCLLPCTGHGFGEDGGFDMGRTGVVNAVFNLGLGLETDTGAGTASGGCFFSIGLGGIIKVLGRVKITVSAL